MNQVKRKLGIWMAGSPSMQLIVAATLFIVAFGIVALITWAFEHRLRLNLIPGRMLSPIPLRDVLEGTDNGKNQGNILAISIAYFIGIVVFSGILVSTITNIFRTIGDHYLNGTAHYRFKDHILFLGYDELMIGTLRNYLNSNNNYIISTPKQSNERKRKKRIIVVAVPDHVEIVRNSIYQHLTKNEQKQVMVVQTVCTNVDDLKNRVWVTKAEQIFIIGQSDENTHDAENLKCLGLISALCSKRRPQCMYYLRNQATFFLIHRQKFLAQQFKQGIENAGLKFNEQTVEEFVLASEPFNFYESMSRHLLFGCLTGKECFSFTKTTTKRLHFVIIGMSNIGFALARTILMTAHCPKQRLRLTFVDEDAYKRMQLFIGQHRTFFDNCHYSFLNHENERLSFNHPAVLPFIDVDVEFVQCSIAHPAINDYITPTSDSFLNIMICTDDSPKNMATALYLPRAVLESETSVWVYQNGYNSMDSFLKHRIYKNIHTFSSNDYYVENRINSIEWHLARTVAYGYDNRYATEITKWHNKQPKDRWSSLYGALSKIISLQAIGKYTDSPIHLTDEEKRILAVTEHNRWNVEKLLNGWTPPTPEQLTSHAKKELNKDFFQPLIAPYGQLKHLTHIDPDVVEKDYTQIEDVTNELNRYKTNEE